MDGFDDLLAPTRDALERNPFADSFGRPSSPDPWTSYQAPASSTIPTDDSDGDPFGTELRSSTPTLDDPGFADTTPAGADTGLASYNALEDPLESSMRLQSEGKESEHAHEPEPPTPTEQAPLASPKSPGFKESVSTTIDDILTSVQLPVEEKQPTPPRAPSSPLTVVENPPLTPSSPPLTSPTESAAPSSASIIGHAPSSAAASVASPSTTPLLTTPNKPSFYSPLDQPNSLDRSFPSLTLGGESVNGWQSMAQGSQSMFVGSTSQPSVPDDEDDDDDKPILQARMNSLERAQRAGSPAVPVSHHFLRMYPLALIICHCSLHHHH